MVIREWNLINDTLSYHKGNYLDLANKLDWNIDNKAKNKTFLLYFVSVLHWILGSHNTYCCTFGVLRVFEYIPRKPNSFWATRIEMHLVGPNKLKRAVKQHVNEPSISFFLRPSSCKIVLWINIKITYVQRPFHSDRAGVGKES